MVNKEGEKGIKFQKLNPAKKSNEGSSWGDNCIASPGSINPEGSSWLESGLLHSRDSTNLMTPGDNG